MPLTVQQISVTGRGWINSPPGAYVHPYVHNLTGKAEFAFVAEYQKGTTVPTGTTKFRFYPANVPPIYTTTPIEFQSTNYQWLVVSGARADWRGYGTMCGFNYGFFVTAIDGQAEGGGGKDYFRIRIWNPANGKTVYDSEKGVPEDVIPTTVVAGGNIIIHS